MITWLKQTKNTCGQTCLAMLAGISLPEAIKIYGRNGSTSTYGMHRALAKLGYETPERLIRKSKDVALPPLCLVHINWRRGKHWCLYAEGAFFDPFYGIYSPETYQALLANKQGRITSYLPIQKAVTSK